MAISIRDLEEAAAGGWRAPEETRMKGDWRRQGRWAGGEGWLLRAADGFTGRANSALASGDPGMPLADAVAEVCRWYTARGLPALVSVAYPIGGPHAEPLDGFLAGRGWPVRSAAATVMTAASAAPPTSTSRSWRTTAPRGRCIARSASPTTTATTTVSPQAARVPASRPRP